jgi:hypothetical protein
VIRSIWVSVQPIRATQRRSTALRSASSASAPPPPAIVAISRPRSSAATIRCRRLSVFRVRIRLTPLTSESER